MQVKINKNGEISLTDFSSAQAYKIAVRMEKDGLEFYRGLVRQVKDAEARREIDLLIQDEEAHLKTFQGLLGQAREAADDAFEEDDIVEQMNSRVFAAADGERLKEIEHRHTAFQEAMNREKRSIVFYEGCLAETADPQAQKAFGSIIEEEKRHLKKFAGLLRAKCISSQDGCLL